ncbi:MAG: arsenic resistance protein, partial [Burkholderiaceae bacterium]
MGTFERFLSVWVFLAILLGVGLGLLVPEAFEQLARLEFAHVNLVVGLLIWLMIYPMMVQIDWSSVRQVGRQPAGLGLTLVVNWVIKPFTMAALAIFFFKWVFADLVSADQADQYIAGMILLGVAPCTAMVFVWSQLVKGDAAYTLVQVSVNDLIMVVAFAPIAAFLLGVTNLTVPWETLLVSVVFYVVLPLLAGVYTRSRLASNPQALTALMARLKPLSMLGLVATVAILFGFQAETMLANPLPMVLIAIPLVLQ